MLDIHLLYVFFNVVFSVLTHRHSFLKENKCSYVESLMKVESLMTIHLCCNQLSQVICSSFIF